MLLARKFNYFAVVILLGLSLASFAASTANTAQAADVLRRVCENAKNKNPNKMPAACADNAPGAGAANNPLFGTNGAITNIINLLSILVGIAAVIMIILGGFKFVTSGSNPQEVTKAREIIIYAIIGLIVVALAQAMVRFVLNRLF